MFRRTIFLFSVSLAILACEPAPIYDIIIKGGTVYDGTGESPQQTDLAINGDIKLQEVLAYAQIFEQYVLTGSDTLSQFKPTTSNDLPF